MSAENNQAGHDRPARSGIAATLLLALAALWCIYWFVHAWQYWEDDAYIHLEFARSVAAGQGFAFNGKVVAGDTAPLWVFLLAGIHSPIPNWLVAGKVLTALGAIFGLAGIYAFARSLALRARPFPGAELFPAAMVLLIVANPYFCYWAFSGMEPIAAAGLACWAVLVATREHPSAKTFLAGCLLAGISPLMRPEMVFLVGLLVLPLFCQWRRLPARPAKPGLAAVGLFLLSVPQTLWSLYSLHAFGHLLPNTNAAKRAAPGDSVVHRLLTVYTSAFPVIVCGLLAGVVYLLLRPSAVRDSFRNAIATAFSRSDNQTAASRASAGLPLAGWIFILWSAIAAIFYIANHTYVQTRYIMVTAPGLTIVVMLLAWLASRYAGRIIYLAALLAAVAICVVTVRPFIRNKGVDCQLNRDIALFMRDRIPPDAPVAVYSIGQFAFDSQHPIIDTGGITRPGAIPYLNDRNLDRMVIWARSQGAQFYISGPQPEPAAVPVYTVDPRFVGWTLHSALYAGSGPLSLWKLPPSSTPPQQTSAPPSPPPARTLRQTGPSHLPSLPSRVDRHRPDGRGANLRSLPLPGVSHHREVVGRLPAQRRCQRIAATVRLAAPSPPSTSLNIAECRAPGL